MERPLSSRFFLAACGLVVLLMVNGCKKSSTSDASVTVPVVITNSLISNLTVTSAQSGGIITSNGGDAISASGICYSSTDQTPTTADTKTITTGAVDVAGTTSFTCALTPLIANTTYYLRAFATNSAGTAYGSVVKFTSNSTISSVNATVSTFAGGNTNGGFMDGSGTGALFNGPQGVATDAFGNVYVADGFNERVREITPGGLVSTYAGNGTAGFTDGTIANAEFYGPQAVATDAQGNVYVADVGNNVIRKITTAGVVSTLAGSGTPGYANGTGTAAEFDNPQALALDGNGNIYVADRTNNVIRKVTPAGVVTTFAGLVPATQTLYQEESIATVGYLDGAGSAALFNTPKSIAVDASGNVYVADIGNYAIRKITPAGVVSTFAGGIVQTTIIGAPSGLAFDTKGNLFISDQDGRVLEITSASVLYTLAGSPIASGYVDGDNEDARFNSPQGIAVDANGNIYVADFNNNAIRKVVVTIN